MCCDFTPDRKNMKLKLILMLFALWFSKSSASTVELNFKLKPQANDIRIS